MKKFLRKNPTIAFGLGLPLLLVIVFLLISGVPTLLVAHPQHDVIYSTNYNDNYPNGIQLSVVNQRLQVNYLGNTQAYQNPRLWRYGTPSGRVAVEVRTDHIGLYGALLYLRFYASRPGAAQHSARFHCHHPWHLTLFSRDRAREQCIPSVGRTRHPDQRVLDARRTLRPDRTHLNGELGRLANRPVRYVDSLWPAEGSAASRAGQPWLSGRLAHGFHWTV